MADIRALARALTTSGIMEGREKVPTEELIGKEISLDKVEFMSRANYSESYYICSYVENPNGFFYSGSVLNEILTSLCQALPNGLDDLNAELAANPLKIILETRTAKTPNKTGRICSYTAVKIV